MALLRDDKGATIQIVALLRDDKGATIQIVALLRDDKGATIRIVALLRDNKGATIEISEQKHDAVNKICQKKRRNNFGIVEKIAYLCKC